MASPLKRARITAEHIAVTTGKSVILDRRLMEHGVGEGEGEWEGRSFTELCDELYFSTAYCAMSTTAHPAVNHAAMLLPVLSLRWKSIVASTGARILWWSPTELQLPTHWRIG
jgi:hypothetical protein